VASRSSEVNFTKNYTLLFFSGKVGRSTSSTHCLKNVQTLASCSFGNHEPILIIG